MSSKNRRNAIMPPRKKEIVSDILASRIKEKFSSENLLQKIENNVENVLSAVKASKDSNQEFSLVSWLRDLNFNELQRLWTNLHLNTTEAILAILGPESNSQNVSPEVSSTAYEFVNAVITFGLETISVMGKDSSEPRVPEHLSETVVVLHSFLPSIPAEKDPFKNRIVKLCESWFSNNLPKKDSVIQNCLIYLLSRTFQNSGALKNDVKRIYHFRDIISNSEPPDLALTSLKPLLLQAARTPLYLKCSEGIKFITLLFSISPEFIVPLHQSIKKVLPGASGEISKAFGEIYYKAWIQSSGMFRKEIEDHCIQDFMLAGVLAKRSLPKSMQVFGPIYNILHRFHRERNCKEAQEAMERLWEPILWRHLKVANALVRCNAASFLFSGFPIENPHQDLEGRTAQQNRQLELIVDLLSDDTPEVRVVAVDGVSRVLSHLWLLFSTEDINRLFKILIAELAFDASSPKVRAAVLRGLAHLVAKCPRSHLYLREILPRISDCLHDINETVRVAMLDLLLEVKNVKTIKFWEISPLEHLLARLSADSSSSICKKIVSLLAPSFFPKDQSVDEKIERCIVMIEKNRLASRKFFQHVTKIISFHETITFMLGVLVNIKKFVSQQKTDDRDSDDKENLETPDEKGHKKIKMANSALNDTLQSTASSVQNSTTSQEECRFAEAFKDSEMVCALLDVVCILWVSQSAQIADPKHSDYRSLLQQKSKSILSLLFKFYKSDDVCRPVVYMCSFLRHSTVSTVVSFCLSRLRNSCFSLQACEHMPEWVSQRPAKIFDDNDPVRTYVDSLCNWGRSSDILDVVFHWFKRDLEKRQKKFNTSAKRSRRAGVRFSDEADPAKPKHGVVLLKYLISHPLNKSIILKKSLTQLEELKELLQGFIPIITRELQDEKGIDAETEVLLAHVWDVSLKLNLLLAVHQQPSQDVSAVVQNFFEWCRNVVISASSKNDLSEYILTSLLQASTNLILLDLVSLVFITEAAEVVCSLISKTSDLNEDFKFKRVTLALNFCKEVANWSSHCDVKELDVIQNRVFPHLFQILMSRIEDLSSHESSQFQDIKSNSKTFLLTSKMFIDDTVFSKIFLMPIFHIIIKDIMTNLQQDADLFESPEKLKSLPYLSSFMVDIVTCKASIFMLFLNAWSESDVADVATFPELIAQTAFLLFISRLNTTSVTRSHLKVVIYGLERGFERLNTDCENSSFSTWGNLEEAATEFLREFKSRLLMMPS